MIGEPRTSKRKIVQVSCCACSDMCESLLSEVYVVCDDGSLWTYLEGTESWLQFPKIPDRINSEEETK